LATTTKGAKPGAEIERAIRIKPLAANLGRSGQ